MKATQEIWGYLAILAIAISSSVATGTYVGARDGSPPYVVFAFVIALCACLIRPVYLVWTRHPSPLSQLYHDLKNRWSWLASVALLLIALPVTMDSVTYLKVSIPVDGSFYLDPQLADMERALLGVDAWKITHSIFGNWWTGLMDAFYGLWHLVNLSLAVAIIVAPNHTFKIHAALVYQLTWLLLGGLMARQLASVGPIFYHHFYEGNQFSDLNLAAAPLTMKAADYLISNVGQTAFGGGISAMPSMHVAISVLATLCLPSRFRWIGWIYITLVWISSIHLGWHYALDGLVSIPCVIAIWYLVGALTGRMQHPSSARYLAKLLSSRKKAHVAEGSQSKD